MNKNFFYFRLSAVLVQSETVNIFDFYGEKGIANKGFENLKDYATLSEDLIGNLPNTFTICSSVFFGNFISLFSYSFFQLKSAEGEPWFTVLDDYTWNIKLKHHTLETIVNGVYKKEHQPFKPLVFNTWHHLCLGINLETGEYTVVQKGNIMKDTVYKEFKNTTRYNPKTLKGNLFLGIAGLTHKNQ